MHNSLREVVFELEADEGDKEASFKRCTWRWRNDLPWECYISIGQHQTISTSASSAPLPLSVHGLSLLRRLTRLIVTQYLNYSLLRNRYTTMIYNLYIYFGDGYIKLLGREQ